jgi:hypothetical protein
VSMPELRTPDSDRPDDRPPESRGQLDVDRIEELNALGDAKAFDPRTPTYNPLEHVGPRSGRSEAAEVGGAERPGLLSLSDKVRAESAERFPPSDAEALAAKLAPGGDRGPEELHRFGNKERPRPVRDTDLGVESWDAIIGPYAPTNPTELIPGASTFIDPRHPEVRMTGPFHRLPMDYRPPEGSGLAIHADGKDVSPDAPHK